MNDLNADLHRSIDGLWEEMRLMRTEMHDEFRAIRSDLAATQRQMTRIGFGFATGLLAVLVVQLIGLG